MQQYLYENTTINISKSVKKARAKSLEIKTQISGKFEDKLCSLFRVQNKRRVLGRNFKCWLYLEN